MTNPTDGSKHSRAYFLLLRNTALGCFLFYIGWNLYWLWHRKIPESILLGVFGIPAPTTGMTRSSIALLRGDWLESLCWNPFTIPVFFLFWGSLLVAITNIVLRKNRVLPRTVVWGWAFCLLAGWIFKLCQGPAWW